MTISNELKDKLINRLEQVVSGDGACELKHKNGTIEHLIVGCVNNNVFVYNDEPDLIRAFEVEGPGARAINIADAAIWLYMRSFEEEITR